MMVSILTGAAGLLVGLVAGILLAGWLQLRVELVRPGSEREPVTGPPEPREAPQRLPKRVSELFEREPEDEDEDEDELRHDPHPAAY